MPAPLTPEGRKRQANEARAKAIAAFPFELIETSGAAALATWEELKRAGRGSPVVLGGGDDVGGVVDNLHLPGGQTAEEILAAAAQLRHPQDLIAKRALDEVRGHQHLHQFLANPDALLPQVIVTEAEGVQRELTPEETRARMLGEPQPPPLGEWPAQPDCVTGLSVTLDRGRTIEKADVALIPTDDWTTIPARFSWGGWNACPQPEYHVAALRAWRDRYGAELVGLSTSCMDLRVARPPQSRADALDLAREHYVYCADIIDQGLGTFSDLAALLLGNAWWSFWWD